MSTGAELREWYGASVETWRRRWELPALQVFRAVGSTNDVLVAAGRAGAPAGCTAIAEHQHRGRGRLGRAWEAPPGTALLCSVLLRPGTGGNQAAAGTLPLRVGLAVAETLRTCAQVTPALKWPNDVLLGGAKVAGILCEGAGDFVVAGIGINVRQTADQFPAELAGTATSLLLAAGAAPALPDLAGALLAGIRPLFTAPHRPLDPDEREALARLDALRGQTVIVDGATNGVAAGIDQFGALLLDRDSLVIPVYAGTVRSLP